MRLIARGTCHLLRPCWSLEGAGCLGGVGGYNVKAVGDDAEGADSETNFGVNAGAGFDFDLGNLAAFVEGRFHAIFGGTVDPETLDDATASFVPITIGIRLGGGS